jgi:hypothetical protein
MMEKAKVLLRIAPGDIPRAGSRGMAETSGEGHQALLEEIEELKGLCDADFATLNFKLDGPEYFLGYAGFRLLIMKYEYSRWNAMQIYQKAFNEAGCRLPEVTERQLNGGSAWYPVLKRLVKAMDAGSSWEELAALCGTRPRWLGKYLARAKRLGLRVNCPAWRNVNKV